jgi:HEAT repeat protein
MDANGSRDDVDQVLAARERLPVEELQIVRWLVEELLEHPDDDARRKAVTSAAMARMSALRSV